MDGIRVRVLGGGGGGEEGVEEREVFRGDEDGDGESTIDELVSEVDERDHVTLRWVWKHQDVGFG